MKREFVRDSFWTILSQGLIFICGVLSSVIVARMLTPYGKGVYAMVGVMSSFLMVGVDTGMGASAIFYAGSSRYSPKVVLSHALLTAIFHSIVAALVGLSVIWLGRDRFFPGIQIEYLLMGLVLLPFQLYMSFVNSIFIGLGQIRRYNAFQILRSALFLVALIFIVFIFKRGIGGALAAEILAALGACLASLYCLLRATGGVSFILDRNYLKDAYEYGSKIYASNFVFFMNSSLNIFLLNLYLTPLSVGLFATGLGVSDKTLLFSDSIGTVLYSRLVSDKYGPNRSAITPLVFKSLMVIVLCFNLVLFKVGGALIVWLYSDSYRDAILPFSILLIGNAARSCWRILQYDLLSRGVPGTVTAVAGKAFLVNLILSIVLIPKYGLLGAAWANSGAGLALLIFGLEAYCGASGYKLLSLFIPLKSDVNAYRGLFVARFG